MILERVDERKKWIQEVNDISLHLYTVLSFQFFFGMQNKKFDLIRASLLNDILVILEQFKRFLEIRLIQQNKFLADSFLFVGPKPHKRKETTNSFLSNQPNQIDQRHGIKVSNSVDIIPATTCGLSSLFSFNILLTHHHQSLRHCGPKTKTKASRGPSKRDCRCIDRIEASHSAI